MKEESSLFPDESFPVEEQKQDEPVEDIAEEFKEDQLPE
jgi:hypothetical protein